MLFKGFFRNLGEPVPSSDKGVLITQGTRLEEEVQVVGSTHSTVGNNAGHRAYKNIVNGTESAIRDCGKRYLCRRAVNLPEELDAGNPHVRFYEGLGTTDTWLKSCGTAGKPGGKRRKQTST